MNGGGGRCPNGTHLRPLMDEERQALGRIARSRTEAVQRVERARIILALADGMKASEAAQQCGVCEAAVHYRR